MNKKVAIYVIILLSLFLVVLGSTNLLVQEEVKVTSNKLKATIVSKEGNKLTVQDKNNIIYTFDDDNNFFVGDKLVIEYTGLLNKSKEVQNNTLLSCMDRDDELDSDGVPLDWKDKGIFSDYYILANNKLKELSLDEKINQLLLVKYPDDKDGKIVKEKQFAGYVFFEKDFKDKSREEVIEMIRKVQDAAKIPLLTAVDEEGGDVVRVSSNKKLREEKFSAPSVLYKKGGLEEIEKDTIEKGNFLYDLGINVNLAPVVDVSTSDEDYIYDRTLQENTEKTAQYAKTVISASRKTLVSDVLKHFPGYGNNDDTHSGTSEDERSLETIKKNDLPPFQAGIDALAEAVLVSHNIVKNIDGDNPASLSASIHNMLRNDLNFTGIIITDDMSMGAVKGIENSIIKALKAGNDLIITGDYETAFSEIKEAVEKGQLSEDLINKLAFRVLAWKYYKGLLFDISK